MLQMKPVDDDGPDDAEDADADDDDDDNDDGPDDADADDDDDDYHSSAARQKGLSSCIHQKHTFRDNRICSV